MFPISFPRAATEVEAQGWCFRFSSPRGQIDLFPTVFLEITFSSIFRELKLLATGGISP